MNAQMRIAIPPPRSSGAAYVSRCLIASMPRRMIATWKSQNAANAMPRCQPMSVQPPQSWPSSASSARAPSQVWIPNQPQATIARASAATFAPRIPKDARTNTGNGIP